MYFIWSLIERFGTNAISLIGNIVLSYLLLPEDFGLVASLAVFTSVVYVFIDCGLSDGLLSMSAPTRRDFNTVFYFNVGVGTALCLLYVLIAPLVARYFGNPEICPVMRAFGGGAFLSGLTIAQLTRLRSQLQFRKIAAINLTSVALALAVAVLMALAGLRYWALVELQVGYTFFLLLLMALFSRWQLRLEFDTARFKALWGFGVNLLFSTLLTQVSQNIFTFILGKYYNPAQAGYMGQAQKLQQSPVNSMENSISGTSFVLIAKYQTQAEKCDSIIRMFGVASFAIIMLCSLLLSVSYPVIKAVFPDAWLPVVPYFRMMLLWGMVYPLGNFMMIVFKLFNKTSVIRNVLIVEKSLIIVLAFSLYPYGVTAMITGAIVLSLLSLTLYVAYAQRVTGIAMKRFFAVYASHLAMGLSIAAVAHAATLLFHFSVYALLAGTLVFVALMLLVCRLFRREYYDFIVAHARALFARH